MSKKITRESLQKDADRRYRERLKLANDYDTAADILDGMVGADFRPAIQLLRDEAEKWRRNA